MPRCNASFALPKVEASNQASRRENVSAASLLRGRVAAVYKMLPRCCRVLPCVAPPVFLRQYRRNP